MRQNGVDGCRWLGVACLSLCLLAAVPAVATESTITSSGSGFIVSSDGYILTNEHVVGDSKTVTVFVEGASYPATVVTKSADSDLALLKIAASDLTPVALGNFLQVQLLDDVVALGYPLPQFGRDLTVSEGRITSFRTNVEGREGRDTLQHDAVITHGSSGGPLFNLKGEVIGVNFAGVEGSGMQLAIPINETVPLLRSIPSFSPGKMGAATQILTAQQVVSACTDSVVYIEVAAVINWQEMLPAPNAVAGFEHGEATDPTSWSNWLSSLGFEVVGEAGLSGSPPGGENNGFWNDVELVAFSDSDSAGRAVGILLYQYPPIPALMMAPTSKTYSEADLAAGSFVVGGVSANYAVSYHLGCSGLFRDGPCFGYGSITGKTVFTLGAVAVRVSVYWQWMAEQLSWRDGYVVSASGQRLMGSQDVLRRLEDLTRLVAVTVANKLSSQ